MRSKRWSLVCVLLVVAASASAVGPPAHVTRIEGVITAIDPAAQTLVVNDATVQVTPSTVILMQDEVLTFDDLNVGMTVMACGTMDGDVLKAHKIMVKYGGK